MNTAKTRQEGPFEGLLIELHYLPCIQYFTHLLEYEKVVLEADEHYPKQTYRNRCRVLTAQKVMTLSVPVAKGPGRPATRDAGGHFFGTSFDNPIFFALIGLTG